MVQAWLLLTVAKCISGPHSFKNRVRLAAAVPHPMDSIARYMDTSVDSAIQRASLYEVSMLTSLSLSARQLKLLIAMLRQSPATMPNRAWGIVGTLRRMVMVSRNETRLPRPNLLPAMQTVRTSTGAVAMVRSSVSELDQEGISGTGSTVSEHGMHLAPRSYFVFGKRGAGLRAVSAVKYHLSTRSRILLERTIQQREQVDGERLLGEPNSRRHDDSGRFHSTHSPANAAFYVGDGGEM